MRSNVDAVNGERVGNNSLRVLANVSTLAKTGNFAIEYCQELRDIQVGFLRHSTSLGCKLSKTWLGAGRTRIGAGGADCGNCSDQVWVA